MDTGHTAWILAAAALVCILIPALALFYGGMVGSRRILNMMMMCFGGVSVVAVLWAVFGYSAVFGNSVGGLGLIGDVTEYLGLDQLLAENPDAPIPAALFAAFQLFFAGITTAIIAGAAAGRMKFGAWMLFAGLWSTLVYLPVAHWVFALSSTDGAVIGGWILNGIKAIDFAGGTAVHVNAGVAALALSLVLGRSAGWPQSEHVRPHSRPLVLVGAGLLWVGWFGFNAGSALAAGNSAAVVFLNTAVAGAAALLGWIAVERLRLGRASSVGAASGLVAGLVAITPACGAVSPLGAIAIGAIAGAVCSLAIEWKFRLGFDDSLDVVGVHLVGGVIGTLLIGLFATDAAPNKTAGLFYGGGFELLGVQTLATAAVLVYSFVVTWITAKIVQVTVGLRIKPEEELRGIDIAAHAEEAYLIDEEPVQLGSPSRS
ncbi:ammonium transporter [Arthrobacter sp. M4]|uniref:ammonium transporter n=1 Tax=Arthrobacter sp. M4 TaxID=218160 RepID=UPI001CDC9ED5|nr:ammonium transporter [Arthrobacter sp. M4]MCA4134967.1 ammonium transporter [Arthrobacter sp. M4]